TVFGCTYQSPEVFNQLVHLIREGVVQPQVSRTYSLQEIAKAQSDFTSKRYPGKLVLLP
ncbi:MAG TPA: alcohol dehydrogenase, partial [Gammaproteobacteria bacterium]|nr:alcohol dehydrogenase [Gammaproteobacteria bacterium]